MRKVLGYLWLKSLPPLKYESVQTAFVPKTHADAGLFLLLQAVMLLLLLLPPPLMLPVPLLPSLLLPSLLATLLLLLPTKASRSNASC